MPEGHVRLHSGKQPEPCPSDEKRPNGDRQSGTKILAKSDVHFRLGRLHHNNVRHATCNSQVSRERRGHSQE